MTCTPPHRRPHGPDGAEPPTKVSRRDLLKTAAQVAVGAVPLMGATADARTPGPARTGVEPGAGSAPDDEAAIRRAALDYIEGWYAGDAARMERALHPELAKRVVLRAADRPDRGDRLEQMSALTLVQKTRAGIGRDDPHPRGDVRLLDRFAGAAVVRVDASTWVDYLQLARYRGEWKIVNVLWELRPTAPA